MRINSPCFYLVILGVLFLNYSALSSSPLESDQLEFTDCFLKNCTDYIDDPSIKFGYINISTTDHENSKVAFVVLEALSEQSAADPVLFLSGGPGSQSIANISRWRNHFLRNNRDIILTDFRGIGYSGPDMCPTLGDAYFNVVAQDLTPEEERVAKMKAVFNCLDSLQGISVNFDNYSSSTIINDLETLRRELGYKAWNIYGGSYGTRVGQAYLRDAPEGLRSFVCEAPHPIGVPILGNEVHSYRKSLHELFRLCESDPTCSNNFKDLEERYYAIMNRLKEQPLILYGDKFPNGRFAVNYQNAHMIFQQLLYFRSFYTTLPWFVKALERGDAEAFKNIISFLKERFQDISLINYIMVMRKDAFGNVVQSNLLRNDQLYQSLAFIEADYDIFQKMDFVDYDSIESLPVQSDIPTLILSGSLDPISPPEHATFLHNNLSNSFHFEFKGMGHGVVNALSCAEDIVLDFLNKPVAEPNNSCDNVMKETSVEFLSSMYENSKVSTLLIDVVVNQKLLVIVPFVLWFILSNVSFFISIIGVFKKTSIASEQYATQITIRVATFLLLLFVLCLGWYIYQTASTHTFLILLGLTDQANILMYLLPSVLVLTLYAAYLLIKHWKMTQNNLLRTFNATLMLMQVFVLIILFIYDFLPNI